MISLFNPTDNSEIINRIKKLTPTAKAQWGKMQVHQMLAHAQQPLKVAFGEAKPKRAFISLLLGGYFKKKIIGNEKPFPKQLPTDKTFVIKHHPAFEEEKTRLIEMVKRFIEKGHEAITKGPHPFFGKMTVEEWDRLQAKHLDHHLRQFGV
jgi:hypothetical protein